jgi:phage terminase large subunit-like protein
MANVKDLTVDSYVKWPVSGGSGFGQILEINDNSVKIESPSGHLADVPTDKLVLSNEKEFQEAIDDLLKSVSKKSKSTKDKDEDDAKHKQEMEDKMKDIEQLKAEIESLKSEVESAKTQHAEYTKEKAEKASEKDALDKVNAELTSKIKALEQEKLAKSRFDSLKAVDSVYMIAGNDQEALEKLGKMPPEAYDPILNAARTSHEKLTKQTQTNLPKATEQTQTNLPKLTESKVEETLKEVKTEITDAALVMAADDKPNNVSLLTKFVESVRESKNKNTKKK